MYKRTTKLETPDSFEFPFEPYQIQKEFMEKLYETIENEKIGIFESPTGTGKTLTLTCGALKWLLDDEQTLRSELKSKQLNLIREISEKEEKNKVEKNWLDSQFETIKIKEELKKLKIVYDLVQKHDRKLMELRNKKLKKKQVRFFKSNNKKSDNSELLENTLEKDQEIDLELNEEDSDLEKESEEEDESEEVLRYSKIYFCSRTHSQLSQVLNEIKRSAFGDKVRLTSLASRRNYCVNEEVKRGASNAIINERCLDLQKKSSKATKADENGISIKKARLKSSTCPFYSKEKIDNLKDDILSEITDIEDLISIGKSEKACPYYASRRAAKDAQIVLLPYQILFHKPTRIQSGIDVKDSVIIVDEAHNLMDTISSIYSREISLGQLQEAQKQIVNYKMKFKTRFKTSSLLKINQIEFIIKQLIRVLSNTTVSYRMILTYDLMADGDFYNLDLVELLSFCEKSRLAQKAHGLAQQMLRKSGQETVTASKSLLEILEEKRNSKKTAPEVVPIVKAVKINDFAPQVLREIFQFLESLLENCSDGRILIESGVKIKYLLLNCNAHFQDILTECRALIVAGGTMKPIDELKNQLFVTEKARIKDFSFNHVVSRDAILPIIVPKGPGGHRFLFNFKTKLDKDLLKDLSMCLLNVCNVVPGGVVIFFSSYDYLNAVQRYLRDEKIIEKIELRKTVFMEPKQAEQTEKTLNDFARAIRSSDKQGAVLLSVVGGKLSEGLNFADELGRCVIVVGMPFPNKTSCELIEKMKYLDESLFPGAGNEYYENICMKAVNQCIGRAVRHISDYATVLLLDERYRQDKILKKLPTWIRNSLQIPTGFSQIPSQLVEFFRNKSK